MAEYTENLNLKKPAQDEQYNVDDFNDNFDKIDDFAGIVPPRALTADKLTTGAKINGVNFKGDTDIITGLGLYSDTNTYNNTNLSYLYDANDKLRIFQSLQNGNIGHNPLTNSVYWKEIQIGQKRRLGEFVTSSLPLIDEQLHLADGSQLSSSDYPELFNRIKFIYESMPEDDFSEASQSSELGSNSWRGAIYTDDKFLALGSNGYISTSTNGTDWITAVQNTNLGSNGWCSLASNNSGTIVALGGDGYISTSTNGTTWTTATKNTNLGENTWQKIVYGAGKFVALSYRAYISTSTNGTTWTTAVQNQDLSSVFHWRSLAYNGSIFVALSGDGATAISTDGTTWTDRNVRLPMDLNWRDLIYYNNNFIAINSDGYISTSPDGITWTTATQNTNLGTHSWMTFATDGQKLVAFGSSGYISVKTPPEINIFVSEAEWQQTYTTYGECGKYVYNSENETVRIPSVNSYFKNTVSTSDLGDITPASIPNITGTFGGAESYNESQWNTGAFYSSGQNTTIGGSSTRDADLTHIDASRVSSVYSNTATTVNTQSIKQLVYIVVKE